MLNLIGTLRDLIINNSDFQREAEIVRIFLIPLEQWYSSILEIFPFSLPNAGAGRHEQLLGNNSRLIQNRLSVHY